MTCDRNHPSWLFAACLLAAVLLPATAGASAARHEVERRFERNSNMAAGQKIVIDNRHGDVTVTGGPGSVARVRATIKASAESDEDAERLVNAIKIDNVSNAAEIRFRTVIPNTDTFIRNGRVNLSFSVDYVVTIPENTPLSVENRFGNVYVSGVKTTAEIDNAHGLLTLQNSRGNHILENSFGGIEVTRNTGNVTITNSNGHVSANQVEGAVSIDDRFGNITVETVRDGVTVTSSNGDVSLTDTGRPTVKNSFGSVTVRTIRGDARVDNANGDIRASGIQGRAELNTSFGKIQADGIRGPLSSTASNSTIYATGVGAGTTVTNSFGEVTIIDVGGLVTVRNSNAGIRVEEVRGMANLATSFGLVKAMDVGGDLIVENSNGAIEAAGINGNADFRSSFAPILLSNVSGSVNVENQNGSIDAVPGRRDRTGCRDVKLQTTFGSISVSLDEAPNYTVSARTSFGTIKTDFPIPVSEAGSFSSSVSMNGALGNGACNLTLVNSNGSIEIRKRKILADKN